MQINYSILRQMAIKAVVWDIGGVMATDPSEEIIGYITEKTGMAPSYVSELLKPSHEQYSRGEINKEKWWAKVCELTGLVGDNRLEELVVEHTALVVENTDLAMELYKLGYKQAILSNNWPDFYQIFERIWIEQYQTSLVDIMVQQGISYRTGRLKPDKEAYMQMLKALGLEPNEVLFIDDKQRNIDIAYQMGLVALHYENPSQLRKEITKMLAAIV